MLEDEIDEQGYVEALVIGWDYDAVLVLLLHSHLAKFTHSNSSSIHIKRIQHKIDVDSDPTVTAVPVELVSAKFRRVGPAKPAKLLLENPRVAHYIFYFFCYGKLIFLFFRLLIEAKMKCFN